MLGITYFIRHHRVSKNSQDPQVNVPFPEVTEQTGFGGAVQRGKKRPVRS